MFHFHLSTLFAVFQHQSVVDAKDFTPVEVVKSTADRIFVCWKWQTGWNGQQMFYGISVEADGTVDRSQCAKWYWFPSGAELLAGEYLRDENRIIVR